MWINLRSRAKYSPPETQRQHTAIFAFPANQDKKLLTDFEMIKMDWASEFSFFFCMHRASEMVFHLSIFPPSFSFCKIFENVKRHCCTLDPWEQSGENKAEEKGKSGED